MGTCPDRLCVLYLQIPAVGIDLRGLNPQLRCMFLQC